MGAPAIEFETFLEKWPEAVALAMAGLAALRDQISQFPREQVIALAELNNLLARSLIRKAISRQEREFWGSNRNPGISRPRDHHAFLRHANTSNNRVNRSCCS